MARAKREGSEVHASTRKDSLEKGWGTCILYGFKRRRKPRIRVIDIPLREEEERTCFHDSISSLCDSTNRVFTIL
ncbi:hypothetical protein CEXT_746481 [Caerostris extrusa]|uniref:Uncharacterized protein n=1 Tax=Caerostris extrusa TaxID=172846 RepID=A0AAV4MGJ7_CAEEX|nr:hypothetical protein CEXT_746481 [Caerostris extrusa]